MSKHKETLKNSLVGLMGVAAIPIIFLTVLLLIKSLWGWIIPDLFPGAVAEGLMAGAISWGSAAKLALALVLLGALFG
jgi:hypothetical protein